MIASDSHPLALSLEKCFSDIEGNGVILCLPERENGECVDLLLRAARQVLQNPADAHFILVHHRCLGGGFGRTLFLENPGLSVCVVDVPFDDARSVQWVLQEALQTNGYSEVRYDHAGARYEPRLVPLSSQPSDRSPLGPQDVLLVTGGVKGIGAACALSLARKS